MAKTSQLNALDTLAQDDLIQVVDVSDTITMTGGGGTNKKITLATLSTGLTSLGTLQPLIPTGTSSQYYRGDKSWQTLNKTTVGLSNVTNESKATMFTNPTFTGTVTLPSTTSIGDISNVELGYLNGVTSNIQTQLDGKLSSSVSSTELGYLSGVTSSIQTQLDSKQGTITGGGSTITSTNLTASRALVSDSSGKVAVSNVTGTELGRLVGVTSSIQTQLDGKANNSVVATGSTTSRSLANRFADVINVKDFGAVGDGVTDDHLAIDSCIKYAIALNKPVKIIFPSGNYLVNDKFGPYFANDLEIDFCGSKIDFRNVPIGTFTVLISFEGSYTATSSALSSGLGINNQTANCSTSGFSKGDMVRIYSNTIWDSTRTNTRIGELNFIESIISPTSLNIVSPSESNYTTGDSARIQKIIPIKNIHLKNGTILAPSPNDQVGGIFFKAGINCTIENISTFDCDIYHIRLTDCILCKVSNCYIEEANEDTQAYGITCTDACQDCLITNNTIKDVRHAFTTNNNTSTSYGITRRITVSHNAVYNNVPNVGGTSGDALDTHAGSEDVYFTNNSIQGAYGIGINVESRSAIIQNNHINGATAHGIRFSPYTDNIESEGVISGNMVNWIGNNDGTDDYGILINISSSTNCKRLAISNNEIHSKSEPLKLTGTSENSFYEVSISGNILKLSQLGFSNEGIAAAEFGYCNNISIVGNVFSGRNIGAYLENCNIATVTGNVVELNATSGTSAYGIWLDTTTNTSVGSNSLNFTGSGVATTRGVFLNESSTYSGVWNNIIKGFSTAVFINASATGSVQANNISSP
jgi:hypothetical protein